MADDRNNFVFGEDLEAILDALEADEDIEQEFMEAVDDVSIEHVFYRSYELV